MNAILVWMLMLAVPGHMPIVIFYDTEEACQTMKVDAKEETVKLGEKAEGGCTQVRLIQSEDKGI